jgi:hypothetical protein
VGPGRLAGLVSLFAEETEGRLARLAARPPWPEVEAEALLAELPPLAARSLAALGAGRQG